MSLPNFIQKIFSTYRSSYGGGFPKINLSIFPDGLCNSVYGGRNITSRHADGSLSDQIQKGDFSNLLLGDYITATTTLACASQTYTVTTNWEIAGFDTQYNLGDTACTSHHIALVPYACIGSNYMNSSNTTSGGYVGSYMWDTLMPKIAAALKAAFGESHVLKYRTLLANAISTSASSMAGAGWSGASNNWAWYDCECNLMSEPQVYGTKVFSSSFYDIGERHQQLPLFRVAPWKICNRTWFWLSSVASSSYFALVGYIGSANYGSASVVIGVRPLFLYH